MPDHRILDPVVVLRCSCVGLREIAEDIEYSERAGFANLAEEVGPAPTTEQEEDGGAEHGHGPALEDAHSGEVHRGGEQECAVASRDGQCIGER